MIYEKRERFRVVDKDARENIIYVNINGKNVPVKVFSKKHIRIGSRLTIRWSSGRISGIIYASTS
jgi:hypothetical protein